MNKKNRLSTFRDNTGFFLKGIVSVLLLFLIVSSCGKNKKELEIKQNSTQTPEVKKEDIKNEEKRNDDKENEITTKEVDSYIGKSVIVKGYVADVAVRPKVAYLNFDAKYPKNTFAAVIFPSDFSKFGDLKNYANKNVLVRGTISTYNGKPQIILNTVSQIEITEE